MPTSLTPPQAMKYIETDLAYSISRHLLRVKYRPSEDTVMIDLFTIQSLELIQNRQDIKSKDSLFGLLNNTLTPMGSQKLRSSILLPLTVQPVIVNQYDVLDRAGG